MTPQHPAPGFSTSVPFHWGPNLPRYLSNSYKAWCLGDSLHITSQCGQAEFIKIFLSNYKNKKEYFYLDIGANDGITNSSTFALACSGWSGLCVEPNPRFQETISKRAKASLFLGCAVGQTCGIFDLITSDTLSVLSTLENSSSRHIERLSRESSQAGEPIRRIPVPVISADLIFDYYFSAFTCCDFLKVDCEGQEYTVIEHLCHLSPAQLPNFVEYENNYQINSISSLLESLGYEPLVVFDSFAEVWYYKSKFPDAKRIAGLTLTKLMRATVG